MPEISKKFKDLLKEVRNEKQGYNKIVNQREEEINKKKEEISNEGFLSNFESEINKKVNDIVITLLKKKGFVFGKDRINNNFQSHRLDIFKGELKYCEFQHKYFSNVRLIRDYSSVEFLIMQEVGENFVKFIREIQSVFSEIKELDNKTKIRKTYHSYNYRNRYSYNDEPEEERDIDVKDKVKIKVEYLDDDEIRKAKITELQFSMIPENRYSGEKYLYNDGYFNACLIVIEKQKEALREIREQIDERVKDINSRLENYEVELSVLGL